VTNMKHAMIDLEAMALTPDAAIVSIGAVLFDPARGKVSDDTFYVELAWMKQPRKRCRETSDWWAKQSPKTCKALDGTVELSDALDDLAFWLPSDVKVWGNGPTFDITMLENAYMQLNMDIPWHFWNIRDCRTVKDMFESARGGFDKKNTGDKHNALYDAQFQAKMICHMWYKIFNG